MSWTKTKIAAGISAIIVVGGLTPLTVKAVKQAHHRAEIAKFVKEIPPGSVLNNSFNRVGVTPQNKAVITRLRAEVWPLERQVTEARIRRRQQVDDTHDATTIDLTPYLNARLTDGPVGPAGNDTSNYAGLPAGVHLYGGVPFDVQGVVYLTGGWMKHFKKDFPTNVSDIRIGRSCTKIHLLQGAALVSFDDAGKTVAKLVLHYSDGGTKELELNAGEQMIDGWAPLFTTGVNPLNLRTAPDTEVAWFGSNPRIQKQQPDESLVLCRTTFENPQPVVELTSIDFVSMDTPTVPFLFGLTVE